MAYKQIRFEREGGLATVTLSHAPVNAISALMLGELEQVLQEIDANAEIRCVLLTGASDKVFCAGADFREFAGEDVRAFQQKGAAIFTLIEQFRKPVIAAINGGAFGGGLELALACHLRYISSAAQLAFTEVRLGIIPGWGGTQRLPRLIGRTRALELLLTGDPINAQDALIYGLVNRVSLPNELLPEARQLGFRLARGAPLAMAAIIDCVGRGMQTTLAEGLQIESAHALELGQSEDALIGVMSMAQKKEPDFTGR